MLLKYYLYNIVIYSRYLSNDDLKCIKTMSSHDRSHINQEIINFIASVATEFQYLHKELDNINMNIQTTTTNNTVESSKESTQVQFYKIILSLLLNVRFYNELALKIYTNYKLLTY